MVKILIDENTILIAPLDTNLETSCTITFKLTNGAVASATENLTVIFLVVDEASIVNLLLSKT